MLEAGEGREGAAVKGDEEERAGGGSARDT